MDCPPFAPAVHQPVPLAALACLYMSAALQSDYLSSGVGHKQSKAVLTRRRIAQPTPSHADTDPDPDPTPDPAADEDPAFSEAGDALPDDRLDLAGGYLAQTRNWRRLSSSEEYCLAAQAARGDVAAASRLVEHNLGLVVMIARRYANGRIPLPDLIQEGNLGLLRACTKFDPEVGCRLSTYAKWWIREAIETALLTQSTVVRIPVHAAKTLRKSRKSGGAEAAPPDGAMAHCLLVDASDGNWSSLDDDDQAQLIDSLSSPADEEPQERAQERKRLDRMLHALQTLTQQEQTVLAQRFGLDGEEPRTLHEVAAPLRVSHERVRQVQAQALVKLREVLQAQGLARAEML